MLISLHVGIIVIVVVFIAGFYCYYCYCYISLLAQADLIPKNSQKNGPLPMAKGLLYSSLLMSLKLFLKFLLFPTKPSSVIIQS